VIEAAEGRKFSEADIKAGYDIESLLEASCKVQVVHKTNAKGSTSARVETVLPLDEDDDTPTMIGDAHYFEINPTSKDIPDWVPKFVGDYIRKSEEFGGGKAQATRTGATTATADEDDDIAF
jgi:hypothetical protein